MRNMTLNYVGEVYGRLVCLSQKRGLGRKGVTWLRCRCSCGSLKEYRSNNLRAGLTKSCGCLFREHIEKLRRQSPRSLAEASTYTAWAYMRQKCLSVKNSSYENYGAQGFVICQRWLKFENFYQDMGDKPDKDCLIISEGFKVFNKKNCLWAPPRGYAGRGGRMGKWWIVKGVRYSSLMKAESGTGVSHATIVNWCNGRKDRHRTYPPKEGCYSELK